MDSPTYLFQANYSAPTILDEPASSDFIDSSLGDWDLAKIDEMFWPEDKEVILGIPLSQLGAEDILV
ncbi:UNVERIFIED_CONTAM: hypothetical protein Sangu_1786400 [Sesamum angustifolium]|uniref:Uncharacterized protein n=1 Tax=Sesamum angustifolium TaxID=2727405 RepID=A0AAW2M832_9LAMI